MKDRYDKAVEYLTEHPEDIQRAWVNGGSHNLKGWIWLDNERALTGYQKSGCLFKYAYGSNDQNPMTSFGMIGCLTMIRASNGTRTAFTPELTEAIAKDERIPKDRLAISVKDLPVFAEWQRKIDAEALKMESVK